MSSYSLILDGSNIVFDLFCWWTNQEQREKGDNVTAVRSLIEGGAVCITAAMDAFIDAMLSAKWDNERSVRVKIFFDKPRGKLHHRVCTNESGTRHLGVDMAVDADPEIIALVANSWLTHYSWDRICVVTNDRELTELIYATADAEDDKTRPTVIVEKVYADIEGCSVIPLHIDLRRSHSLLEAGRPLLHL